MVSQLTISMCVLGHAHFIVSLIGIQSTRLMVEALISRI